MKYTLKRNSIDPVEMLAKWEVKELTLEGADLIETLRSYLPDVMEGILDPDTAGKKPDRYLANLQTGRLGDFSRRYIITARDNDKLIGLLIGLPAEEKMLHIYTLGVLPEYRNRGVGSELLGRCINDMLKDNVHEIILDVHSDNIPAYNLYKKFGFQE